MGSQAPNSTVFGQGFDQPGSENVVGNGIYGEQPEDHVVQIEHPSFAEGAENKQNHAGYGVSSSDSVKPTDYTNRQDHKDSLNRYVQVEEKEKDKDHYLNPDDGKLMPLRVQRVNDYRRDPSLLTTWSDPLELNPFVQAWKSFRESPWSILTWTYKNQVRERGFLEGSLSQRGTPYNRNDIYWKYPIACLLLTFTALFGNFEGKSYPGGRYPPVRYKYFSYPKTPRNKREAADFDAASKKEEAVPLLEQTNDSPAPSSRTALEPSLEDDSVVDGVVIFKRRLRPRTLCVIRENADGTVYVEPVDTAESTGGGSATKTANTSLYLTPEPNSTLPSAGR
ncbi:hypothetical protein O1611_g9269 [Lasiodiplodia mahajangana]|uniref:Uncharacterized protein n=1 Tax=Lasiodiplodia mahajangana TaxID=1108764 RepID=A0ACC2JA43_9PEZI|nr:hypothetical protein O1611_g9269 [Lasiodiplodia mahajangana]